MTASPWPAPLAGRPVRASVTVPGSKSLTNRYLVLAALAEGASTLRRPLHSRDTALMVASLQALGVAVHEVPGDGTGPDWHVEPGALRGPATVDCGLAGTVMRFVPVVAALADGPVHFDGDAGARVRPMGPVVAALRDLGVAVDDDGRGTLPFTVHGTGSVAGGEVVVDASTSSQFVSALLLAGARFDKGLRLRHVGPPVPSAPHVEMTVEVLRDRGVAVDDSAPDVWQVGPGAPSALDVTVEPDLSNAAPFLAAALVSGGTVRVPGWPGTTTQAGDHLRDLLDQMGAEVTLEPDGLTVTGTGEIYGLDADLSAAGELTPVVAALAALADTPSRLRGVAHLRGHETDRLKALAAEINRLGGAATETDDGLAITPRPLTGTTVRTYHDHRMAMAAAVIGLRVPGVLVEDVQTVGKTLPDFTDRWAAMLQSGQV